MPVNRLRRWRYAPGARGKLDRDCTYARIVSITRTCAVLVRVCRAPTSNRPTELPTGPLDVPLQDQEIVVSEPSPIVKLLASRNTGAVVSV